MEGINTEIKVPIGTNLTQLYLYGLLPQNPHPYVILSAENEIWFIDRMAKLEKNEMDYVTSMTNQVNNEKQGENKDTIMQKWAEESLRYSESVNKLFSEFGFKSEYFVKDRIKAYFNENYLKLFHKINTNGKYKWLVTSDELRTTYILWRVLPNGELSKIKQSKSPAGFKAIIDADSREKHGV